MTSETIPAIELAIPPYPEYLQLVRALVGAAASSSGARSPLGPGRVADLRLVVSEAATKTYIDQKDSWPSPAC